MIDFVLLAPVLAARRSNKNVFSNIREETSTYREEWERMTAVVTGQEGEEHAVTGESGPTGTGAGRSEEGRTDAEEEEGRGGDERDGRSETRENDRELAGRTQALGLSVVIGHALRHRAGVLWCDVCGAYGLQRAGARLKDECKGSATRHRKTRLLRLQEGRHQLTGAKLQVSGPVV